jgi:hypothetical protein
MFSTAEFISQCGDQAVRVLRAMEKQGKVTGYTMKPLETLVVPEDWQKVANLMEAPGHKATAMRLRDVVDSVTRARWWSWCLLHPELDLKYIHPSRSMYPYTLPGCLGVAGELIASKGNELCKGNTSFFFGDRLHSHRP